MFAFLIFDKARNESAHDYSLFEDDNNQSPNFEIKNNTFFTILYSIINQVIMHKLKGSL